MLPCTGEGVCAGLGDLTCNKIERSQASPFGILVHPDLYSRRCKDQVPFNHDGVCCIACICPAPECHGMIACHFLCKIKGDFRKLLSVYRWRTLAARNDILTC